jgi:hypothetical protein
MADVKAMQRTMVHLTQEQKSGLAQRAQQRNTKVASEIRSAVDAYLAGVTPQEFELLNACTRHANVEIEDMVKTVDQILAGHTAFLREMRKLRKDEVR